MKSEYVLQRDTTIDFIGDKIYELQNDLREYQVNGEYHKMIVTSRKIQTLENALNIIDK